MIKNWEVFNGDRFRYSKSDLSLIVSDLLHEELVKDLEFEKFYYNKGQTLADAQGLRIGVKGREKDRLIDPKWENKPLYMLMMTLSSPGEFIPVQGVYYDEIESFKKIYMILDSIKSWSDGENLTFLHQFNDRKLRLIFIQND